MRHDAEGMWPLGSFQSVWKTKKCDNHCGHLFFIRCPFFICDSASPRTRRGRPATDERDVETGSCQTLFNTRAAAHYWTPPAHVTRITHTCVEAKRPFVPRKHVNEGNRHVEFIKRQTTQAWVLCCFYLESDIIFLPLHNRKGKNSLLVQLHLFYKHVVGRASRHLRPRAADGDKTRGRFTLFPPVTVGEMTCVVGDGGWDGESETMDNGFSASQHPLSCGVKHPVCFRGALDAELAPSSSFFFFQTEQHSFTRESIREMFHFSLRECSERRGKNDWNEKRPSSLFGAGIPKRHWIKRELHFSI